MEITTEYVKEARPKVYDRYLLDLIFAQPYCRISTTYNEVGKYRVHTPLAIEIN